MRERERERARERERERERERSEEYFRECAACAFVISRAAQISANLPRLYRPRWFVQRGLRQKF